MVEISTFVIALYFLQRNMDCREKDSFFFLVTNFGLGTMVSIGVGFTKIRSSSSGCVCMCRDTTLYAWASFLPNASTVPPSVGTRLVRIDSCNTPKNESTRTKKDYI